MTHYFIHVNTSSSCHSSLVEQALCAVSPVHVRHCVEHVWRFSAGKEEAQMVLKVTMVSPRLHTGSFVGALCVVLQAKVTTATVTNND